MNRLPSLSHYDRVPDVTPQARSARLAWRGGAKTANLPLLAGDGCWCGGPYGHDWEGKASGAAHPRAQRDGSGR